MPRRSLETFIESASAFHPTRTHLLAQFRLDKRFVWGSGHHVEDTEGRRYLDFLAQYGVLSLGHNHPELCDEVAAFLGARGAIMTQPFPPVAAEALAERLVEMAPGDLAHAIFTNSGAESVEAAIKLARARTGRMGILSTVGGFHGKTMGALSATGRPSYQKPFGAPIPGFAYVPFGDLEALERALRAEGDDRPAAFFVEPVQGEGGVVPAPEGYLQGALALCRERGVLFVLDEVQTGLGRTGEMFTSIGDDGPDILLLAKALGGGIVPIGAMLATSDAWDHEFGFLHSSTFANNNLVCRVALKALEILERDDQRLVRHVARNGVYLLDRLRELARRFPAVIAQVRGQGYLAGVEFHSFEGADSHVMTYLSNGGYLVPALCGYLLNVHGLITAPVFNNSQVVRLEPPFTVDRPEIDRAIGALEVLCDALDRRDVYHVLRFLIGDDEVAPGRERYESRRAPLPVSDGGRGRFAFLVHPTCDAEFVQNDESLRRMTPAELARWREWSDGGEPGIVDSIERLRSPTGAEAAGDVIIVPLLPRTMLDLGRRRLRPVLEDAVELAAENGGRIAGLGGFTSILTDGGRDLAGRTCGVTSGNSLTAVMAVEGAARAAERLGRPLGGLRAVVIGASGSVGRLVSLLAASRVGELSMVGNVESFDAAERMREIAGEVGQALLEAVAGGARPGDGGDLLARVAALPGRTVEALLAGGGLPTGALRFDEPLEAALPRADVVFVATNAAAAFLGPELLKPGAIVCDVARPRNVSDEVARREDVIVFEGGLATWPEPVRFGPILPGAPAGVQLGCFTECVVLAMEGVFRDFGIGRRIPLAETREIAHLAERHGFTVAPPIAFGREVTEDDFERVRSLAFARRR